MVIIPIKNKFMPEVLFGAEFHKVMEVVFINSMLIKKTRPIFFFDLKEHTALCLSQNSHSVLQDLGSLLSIAIIVQRPLCNLNYLPPRILFLLPIPSIEIIFLVFHRTS